MMAKFLDFYREQEDLKYNVMGKDGKALKMIIASLRKQCVNDEEVAISWGAMLDAWDQLDPFYRKQNDLTQINGNLNRIMRELKNGKTTEKKGNRNRGDDLREGL